MTRPKILIVLSAEQRAQYAQELSGLEQQAGVDFVHHDDGEEALERIAALEPRLVVVGLEVGPMEGLEFLALLTRRYPDFVAPVVVLPAKGDPFPPVVHQRDAAARRSATENIDLDGLRHLVAQVAEPPAEPPAAAAAPAAPAAPEPAVREAGFEFLNATDRLPAAGSRPRWLLYVGVAGVVAVGVVLGLFLLRGGGEPAASGDAGAGDPRPVIAADARAQAPDAGAGAEAPAADRGAPATAPPAAAPAPAAALRELRDLPLRFPVGLARFEGDAALEAVIGGYRAALQQHPRLQLEVGGHTSDEGAAALNRKLGAGRAGQVKELLSKLGIPAARMITKNYGPSRPTAANDTPEGRQQNRRVTLRLVGAR